MNHSESSYINISGLYSIVNNDEIEIEIDTSDKVYVENPTFEQECTKES
jgi:hypothetical protein